MPKFNTPVANLSLTDPRCNNDSCKAFYLAHQASQTEISWASQFDYGHCATWYYVTVLAIFAVAHASNILRARFSKSGSLSSHLLKKLRLKGIAAWRYFAYRRLPGRLAKQLELPAFGLMLFLVISVLYFCLLTFIQRPYYREHRGYGSPPIAVRTGLMSVAMTPLIIALSGKASLVTLLTGIGHEKLNIIHRWVGYIALGLATVHTVPFIVAPLKDGGYAELHRRFYAPGAYEYTGVPPLGMLVGLVALSIPWVRRHAHKAFFSTHVLLAITYLGLMFWHSGNIMDSWVYLWATIALWLVSMIVRALWFNRPTNFAAARWFVGSPMVMKSMPEDMTKLEILAPQGFRWSPGQHCFLRVPAVSVFDNHPFSIASADSNSRVKESLDEPRPVSLFVRSHDGFTRRLSNYLAKNSDTQIEAWIDGPYGSVRQNVESHYENILLVAGGSGISACLPWLEDFVAKLRDPASKATLKAKRVKLVWAIRERATTEWIADNIQRLDLALLVGTVEVVVHVTESTSERTQSQESGISDMEKEAKTSSPKMLSMKEVASSARIDELDVRIGRPHIGEVVAGMMQEGSTFVIGCGPESLKVDLANVCADAQKRVLRGEMHELSLWIETFGW